jgi:hypothetical protein
MLKKLLNNGLLIVFVLITSQLNAQVPGQRIEPEFTTTDRLMTLNKGLTKLQVYDALKVYPFDILYSSESKCETHVYKVSITRRVHNRANPKDGTDEQLTTGSPYNDSLRDFLVYFVDGKLEGFMSRNDEKKVYQILALSESLKNACSPIPLQMRDAENNTTGNDPIQPQVKKVDKAGCMDPASLTYDSEATYDDGSCRYCDCGLEPARLAEIEIKAGCPPCLPGKELWSIWVSDGQCGIIRDWVYKYPPLYKRLPADYFKSKDCDRATTSDKDCDWCDIIGKKPSAGKVTVELNTAK